MGTKRSTNETIHIGDIFRHDSYGECGSSSVFYQVVGLRGKTLVEIRQIRCEDYVDETCQLCYGEVKVRPLPGQFFENDKARTVRACGSDENTGRNWLRERGETSRVFGTCYHQVTVDEIGRRWGYDGFYSIHDMEKEGKLPL